MRKFSIFAVLFVITFFLGYFVSLKINILNQSPYVNTLKEVERPLDKYSIENLSTSTIKSGEFEEINLLSKEDKFNSYLFRYSFNPDLGSLDKNTTGIINRPKFEYKNTFPIAILIRGYVDQKSYSSGIGTNNMGKYLAQNGYITIAPDFLGYAGSDHEAENIFESRFQTYITIISLIKTVEENKIVGWDKKNIVIWGHSNGGQIALTVLEISGGNYPTVLWAPVSKPFPYSILYYTDESDDHGKFIRSELSVFEKTYDIEKYSLTNYLNKINAPIQLHQGSSDNDVPLSWSNSLRSSLESLNKSVEYIKHSGADHNMTPDWNNAAKQTLTFFNKYSIN